MRMYTGPPVIGVGLPQAGPSEVLTTVPLRVWASSERSDVPGADVPFLQSTASGLFTDPVHRPSARWASHVTALSPITCAQPEPHGLTVHIVGAFPAAIAGAIPPLRITVYLPGFRLSAQAGPARPTDTAPNSTATATVRSILMHSPCRDLTFRRSRATPTLSGSVESRVARSARLEPPKNCREQNAVKAKIVDCAGCAHKREPLVTGT